MAGSYELKKGANDKFHFTLKAANGQVILSSQMYAAKKSALAGIASVQKHSPDASLYVKAESSNGKFYFTLKASNSQVIGSSQMYASAASRDAGVASVQTNGATTTIKDTTVE